LKKIPKFGIVAVVMLGVLYLVSQIFFLHYYQVCGIPFGRIDVDNYMDGFVNRKLGDVTHTLLYISGDVASQFMDMRGFFTLLIPLLSCLILPMTVFIFMLYFSRDVEMSFVGLVFYIIGSYSMQAFMISAYWSQLYATIFFFWFVIMLEEYGRSRNRHCLVVGIICAILMFISHMKFAGAIVIYLFSRAIINNDKRGVLLYGGVFVAGIIMFPNVLVNDYPISMGVDYVLGKFLMPLLWVMFLISVFVYPRGLTDSDKALVLFAGGVFAISSTSALWRPLITVLPIFVYYSIRCLMALRGRRIYYPVLVCLIVICLVYSYTITLYALNSMLGEMIPGTFEHTYRNMDPNPFLHMFSNGNIPVYKSGGFVSVLGWSANETDEVLYGSE
jgi:hypothetical protein